MEWTQKAVIQFIEAYKKKDIIWNPKHPFHFNKRKKQNAWEELAKEINKPVGHCKKKMENLLSGLRRERMKIRKSKRAGREIGETYESSWFAYKSFSFIADKNKPQQALNTTQHEKETRQETEEETAQERNSSDNTDQLLPSPPTKKKKTKDERFGTACSIDDDSQHFGNLVATKLRNYNYTVQCEIQNEIMGIFLKANRGFYDHCNSFPLQPMCRVDLPQTSSVNPSSPPSTLDVVSAIKSQCTYSEDELDCHVDNE